MPRRSPPRSGRATRGFPLLLLAVILFPSCRSAFLLVDVQPIQEGAAPSDLLVFDFDRLRSEGISVEAIPGPCDEQIVDFAVEELGLRGSEFQVVSSTLDGNAVAAIVTRKREDGELRSEFLLAARQPRGSRCYALLHPLPAVDLETTAHSCYVESAARTWNLFGWRVVDTWRLRGSFFATLPEEPAER